MGDDSLVDRFHELKDRYDAKHGRGATLDVIDDLGLGNGTFNEQLSTAEVERLCDELADRVGRRSDA